MAVKESAGRKDKLKLAVRRAFAVLQLAVLVLELAGVIDWYWAWVFAPTWLCVIAVVLLDLGAAAVKVHRQLKEEQEKE